MPSAVLAAERGAGDADKAVAAGIFLAADWYGGHRGCGADGAADHTGGDFGRGEAAVATVPPDMMKRTNRARCACVPFRGCAVFKPV